MQPLLHFYGFAQPMPLLYPSCKFHSWPCFWEDPELQALVSKVWEDCQRSSRTRKDVERLPTSHLFLLTPSLFLQSTESLLLSSLGFFFLLMLTALMKIFHHNSHKHVEDKEGNYQQEGDEVEEHPRVIVHDWLQGKGRSCQNEHWLRYRGGTNFLSGWILFCCMTAKASASPVVLTKLNNEYFFLFSSCPSGI